MLRLSLTGFAAGLILTGALAGTERNLNKTTGTCISCHSYLFTGSQKHFATIDGHCEYCHITAGDDTETPLMVPASSDRCVFCHADHDCSATGGVHCSQQCVDCHNPHSSDLDHLHMQPHNRMCLDGCHTDHDLATSHPRGAGVLDPLTGDELTCVSSCHSMHNGRGRNLLQSEATALCISCHPDKP